MFVMLWIFLGLVAGWLAGRSLEGNGYGRSMDLAMGAGGALLGVLVMRSAGFSGNGGVLLTTFAAICCAALLTILVALANGRTVYSRAL
jgi:uncharacterized membrane protein YeaQ/YmgE (transglycosylase-associated protein family)